jgi:UDP-N-acetylmuramyl pentapeptide phosphotransferase/UDP-N-acetylglucosamine-1-phosphate transferase
LLGAFLIAFISWLDDLYSVSIIWRLAVQTFSAWLIVSAFLTADYLAVHK